MLQNILIRAIERFVRKTKNPEFSFDEGITSRVIFNLLIDQLVQRARGLKLFFGGKLAPGLQLGVGVRFKNIQNIKFEPNIRLGDYVYLDGLGKGFIELMGACSIGAYSRLVISSSYANLGAYITIGKNVAIGEFAYIGGAGGVSIGKDTIVGQYLSIHPENHIFESKREPIRLQGITRQGIVIGEDVWIGAKVTILDNVRIGDGCVICAGAVVTSGVYPAGSIIAGCPAKIIRTRN